jgi:hypothetical protein
MADAFTSQPESVGSLLGPTRRERIVVPAFQRGYAWTDNNIDAFWRDVSKFRVKSQRKDGPEAYFLGPIVTLNKKEDKTIHLLDGQQRLATATILFSVIRDLAKDILDRTGLPEAAELKLLTQKQYIEKEDGSFALELGETDSVYFQETIQRADGSDKRPPKIVTHKKIKKAKDKLTEEVARLISGMSEIEALTELKSLRQALVSDLIMARIRVESSKDAFQIFETLNARGLGLSAPDLLLNYLMGHAPESNHKSIRDLWTEMIQRIGTEDINRFLRHMWVSQHGDLKEEDLFTALSANIESKELGSLDFVRDCADECESYIQIIAVDEAYLPPEAVPFVRALVLELAVTATYPLLLSTYLALEAPDFVNVVRWILVFVTRYAIVANLNRSGMETLLYKLAAEVRVKRGTSKEIAAHVREALVKNVPDINKMQATVQEIIFETPKEAKYFINRIARYMQDRTKSIAPNEVNIEHIYPQNPEENEWGGKDNQERLNLVLWHIGNLTVYGKRANRKVANKEYAEKRPRFSASPVTMTSDVAVTYDRWDEDTIHDRALRLAKLAAEIWRFENPTYV